MSSSEEDNKLAEQCPVLRDLLAQKAELNSGRSELQALYASAFSNTSEKKEHSPSSSSSETQFAAELALDEDTKNALNHLNKISQDLSLYRTALNHLLDAKSHLETSAGLLKEAREKASMDNLSPGRHHSAFAETVKYDSKRKLLAEERMRIFQETLASHNPQN